MGSRRGPAHKTRSIDQSTSHERKKTNKHTNKHNMNRENSHGSNRSLEKFMGNLLRQKSSLRVGQTADLIIVNDNARTQSEHSTPPSPVIQRFLARGLSKTWLDTHTTSGSTYTSREVSPLSTKTLPSVDDRRSNDKDDENDTSSSSSKVSLLPFGETCTATSCVGSSVAKLNTSENDCNGISSGEVGSTSDHRWNPLMTPHPPMLTTMKPPQRRISEERVPGTPGCSCPPPLSHTTMLLPLVMDQQAMLGDDDDDDAEEVVVCALAAPATQEGPAVGIPTPEEEPPCAQDHPRVWKPNQLETPNNPASRTTLRHFLQFIL